MLIINGLLVPWNTNQYGARIEFLDDLMFLIDADAQVYDAEKRATFGNDYELKK